MKKLIYPFVMALLISGCSTNFYASRQLNFVNYAKTTYPAQKDDCPIDLFSQDKPQKPYEIIGEIMGFVVHGKNVRSMLEAKARQAGGDGVIDIVTSQGTMTDTTVKHELINPAESYETRPVAVTDSYTVINIKAKVIKYKTTNP